MAVYLWIALGSAIGGVARYWTYDLVASYFGQTFPWGTLAVNFFGSFLIGLIATLTSPDGRLFAGAEVRQFLMIGLCGGYTTFSTFSMESLELLRNGELHRAGAYVAASVLVCILAVWLGYAFAAGLNQLKGP
jgi:fluoride exporter